MLHKSNEIVKVGLKREILARLGIAAGGQALPLVLSLL